ncbi:hypothetical protein [Pedobacter hartonius]|uniref:Uncharacterized protein n=1 Tax=Pedobacter hartonius TaxID=425514 RepID=A0A1H4FYK9_9SPHI|nr:hypothetical protein [Pedobacter hartonius]SEB02433.1 hypothetical protein SAMN05443550_108225 [Pedobacter hartonius]
MMQFKFLDEVIPSLTFDLAVLRRDTTRYSMLLYQHEGTLFGSAERVGNNDQTLAYKQSNAFLELLRQTNADLGVTPEYVVPWACLKEILDDTSKYPKNGKLWLLGMESIKKEDIAQFAADCTAASVKFHYDESVLEDQKSFLNTLIYVFWGKIEGTNRFIVIAQFKTKHMGVWGTDLERNGMVDGKVIYVLKNNNSSVRLFTVVCSEAMNLAEALTAEARDYLHYEDSPYLLINPQVNPGPIHKHFLDFRNAVLSDERKEIISLNWSSNSRLGHDSLLKEGSGRSGIYTRSGQFSFGDTARIVKNHNLGMYYFYPGKDRHAFVLESKTSAFLIENLPVHITGGVAAQQRRNGPEVTAAFKLKNDFRWEALETVSDGHIDFLKNLDCENSFLMDPNQCILEKERLACLSSGEIPEKSDLHWSDVDKLLSLHFAETTEINNRATVAQDTSGASSDKRAYYAKAIEKLGGVILKDAENYPPSLAGLKNKTISVGYSQKKNTAHQKLTKENYFRYNMVAEGDEMIAATVCFLPLGGRADAVRVYERLRGLFTSDSMSKSRVVVYYETNQGFDCVSDLGAGSITTDNSTRENSITR